MTDDETQRGRPRRLESEAAKYLGGLSAAFGRDAVRVVGDAARSGEAWAANLLCESILPAVQKHEIEIPGVDAVGLLEALQMRAARDAQHREWETMRQALEPLRHGMKPDDEDDEN